MARLILKQNKSLKKAKSPLKQHGWRGTEFQVKLVRQRTGNGKYHIKAQIKRERKEYHGNNRGLLHKAVNLKYRIKGDKPSVTKYLDSIQTQTFKGEVLRLSAKSTYKITKQSSKTALSAALAAETAAYKTGGAVYKHSKDYLVNKYRSEATDDCNKGTIAAITLVYDAGKGTYSHFKQKKRNRLEKERYRLQKQTARNFKKNTYQPKLIKNRQELRIIKQKRKSKRKLYRSNADDLTRKTFKQLNKRQKHKYKLNKRIIKVESKQLKTEKRFNSKNIRVQRKIVRDTKPSILLLQPVAYTTKKLRSTAWQKAMQADENNDFMQAADTAKTQVYDRIKEHNSKQNKQQRDQKKRDEQHQKENKQNQKLQKQEYKLKEKKSDEKAKKISKSKNKSKSKSEKAKEAFKFVKNALYKIGTVFLGAMLVPFLIILVILMLIMSVFSSCMSGSGYILGTYTAQDYDLSRAEEYYTQLANIMNQRILRISTNGWKHGLDELGADTSEMTDKPTELYWGNSPYFNYDPLYDFDPYMLWSFLCAYYYDFAAPDDGSVNYWEYDDDTKAVIKEIFEAEYQFEYHYDNTSGWDELPNYVFANQDGYRKKCLENNLEWDNADNVIGTIKTDYNPSSLSSFTRINGDGTFTTFYSLDNLEVLNYNKNYAATGWYIMDEGMTITSGGNRQTGMYKWDDYEGWGYYVGNTWYDRDTAWFSWYMPGTDVELKNTPIATIAKADASKMGFPDSDTYGRFTYYQKYDWVEDCRLYYNVKRIKTFEEVIKDKLESMDYPDERLQYYMLLVGDDGEKYYGNHQTLKPIVEGDSIIDYVSSGKILNWYGYDMQEWNSTHCGINNSCHKGIDIVYPSGSTLYAPLDEITIKSYDPDAQIIILRKENVNYWYENSSSGDRRDTEVTICNAVLLNGYAEGSILKLNEAFAVSTGQRKCDNINNSVVTQDYVHIKVKTDTDGFGWNFIDPLLVFY